jgi:hypothetical protein
VTIKLGRVNIEAPTADDEDINPSVDIAVKTVHIHPKYTTLKKYNDIALIELAESVNFTSDLRPACLHIKNQTIDSSRPLQITGNKICCFSTWINWWNFIGWGRLTVDHLDNKATWLMKANTSEVPFNECKSRFDTIQPTPHYLREGILHSQICAIAKKNGNVVDTCQGKIVTLIYYVQNKNL